MKFCKDCANIRGDCFISRCRAPQRGVDLVNGLTVEELCDTARLKSTDCGPEGRWFTPIAERPVTPSRWQKFLAWLLE